MGGLTWTIFTEDKEEAAMDVDGASAWSAEMVTLIFWSVFFEKDGAMVGAVGLSSTYMVL